MTDSILLARLRSSRWRRLAFALIAVPAIVVGLLAMHVLAASGMGSAGASYPVSEHTSDVVPMHEAPLVQGAQEAAANPGVPAPAEDCGGMCGPSRDMIGMICVLALLVTMVLLTVHLTLIRWERLRRAGTALVAQATSLSPPTPPSLHVLSISRT
ncbi:DUF6153 family protein [Pseudolysinimonas sp.]